MQRVRIGIVGDFDRGKHSHWATEAALFHSAAKVGAHVEPRWIATSSIMDGGVAQLSEYEGIWGAPGSPFDSVDGMLCAIEHARTSNIPYLGTCAGFQYALIEYTRNVLGIPDADTAENDPDGRNVVITPVQCALPQRTAGDRRLSGEGVALPVAGTLLARLTGNSDLRAEYFCSFETNAAFIPRWQEAGLRVAACGADGEMRALELPQHRFFVATLFQPQLSSSYERPHPIIDGYLRACAG